MGVTGGGIERNFLRIRLLGRFVIQRLSPRFSRSTTFLGEGLVGIEGPSLTNLLGDDVFDFVIALRMFTTSMVIQKRVEDLQLGVKSYQKKINVTKIEITRPDIRKKDPYTPYQDPQGFIYVDT
ncbi:hypothetical protein Tco_0688125 [Tanacetum coccineum]